MKLPRFKSKVFLAPMADVTDPAFRLLCHDYGAGLTVTELTSVNAIVARGIKDFVEFGEKEKPRSVQLFGSDLDKLSKASKIVSKHFDIIDYNMGCPSTKITSAMAGAALLQKKELTRDIFRTLISSVKKPVSLKMRSCVKKDNLFRDIAKIAEDEGISMITLHPRTVKQGYSGSSNWKLIKELKSIVDVPVVGNGDIVKPEYALRMFKETGCDYVMVGRAARGNPFIFEQINDLISKGNYNEYSSEDKVEAFFKYLKYSKKFKSIKFSNVKVNAVNFTKGLEGGAKLREQLVKCNDVEEIKDKFYKQ